jgi:AhpD family alkylhydroperoxidase
LASAGNILPKAAFSRTSKSAAEANEAANSSRRVFTVQQHIAADDHRVSCLQKEREMESRLEAQKASPGAYHAMVALEGFIRKSSKLELPLLELIRMRASQINGCAFCIDMHSKDARAGGETEQRLYALSAWRETPFFTDRERAALAWTEAVTLVHQGHVPDDVYQEARKSFSDEELVNLTLAVVAINGWNRMAISFRAVPGNYQPAERKTEAANR